MTNPHSVYIPLYSLLFSHISIFLTIVFIFGLLLLAKIWWSLFNCGSCALGCLDLSRSLSHSHNNNNNNAISRSPSLQRHLNLCIKTKCWLKISSYILVYYIDGQLKDSIFFLFSSSVVSPHFDGSKNNGVGRLICDRSLQASNFVIFYSI